MTRMRLKDTLQKKNPVIFTFYCVHDQDQGKRIFIYLKGGYCYIYRILSWGKKITKFQYKTLYTRLYYRQGMHAEEIEQEGKKNKLSTRSDVIKERQASPL